MEQKKALRFALLGAGRIGRLHAANLMANPNANLVCVYDVDESASEQIAREHGVPIATSVEMALGSTVDAALIAATTESHLELLLASVRAGKAVLCEKPIDLDLRRVDQCRSEVNDSGVTVQIGFNRRFDPTHRAVRDAIDAGHVGQLEQLIMTSRDPSPPSLAYLESSGGIFRDMMIHDFDLARFLMDEEFVRLYATGSVLANAEIAGIPDFDAAMVIMETASGRQCHINCSRHAAYGYDQRVEAFGSLGMVQSGNRCENTIVRHTADSTEARAPLQRFFSERYPEAFSNELDGFIDAVQRKRIPLVTFDDGRAALILAEAATESAKTRSVVAVQNDDVPA